MAPGLCGVGVAELLLARGGGVSLGWVLKTGLLSNQGEKSINFYFIMVPLRKKYYSMVLQSQGEGTSPNSVVYTFGVQMSAK